MKKAFIFLIIILMAFVTGLVSTDTEHSVSIGAFSNFLPQSQESKTELLKQKIAFVGDVLLARRVETYLDAYGSDYVYSELPTLSTTTVLVGNFESAIPLEHVQTPDMTFSFSVDADHISALNEYGFQYFGLANNHTNDKGEADFIYTEKVLSESGITSFGSPTHLSSSSVEYVELDDMNVALIAVYAVNQTSVPVGLEELLSEASLVSDFQVIYIHWGIEYELTHSKVQQQLAHTMIDFGADAVIGHHPHVVQDIELYNNVPIFYSLGNFIFDQYFDEEVQKGLWVDLSFEEGRAMYSLQGVSSIGSRSAPRFMSAYENDLFLKKLSDKSSVGLKGQILEGLIR